MNRLNPEKLHVEFRSGVTLTEPILGRKYTLTHSDLTGELFLTVGLTYAYDKINKNRDEVLAEWTATCHEIMLLGSVYVNGTFGRMASAVRYAIFRRELPLALEAIRYGDRRFFFAHPELMLSPVWIRYDESTPENNRFEYWGTFQQYQ